MVTPRLPTLMLLPALLLTATANAESDELALWGGGGYVSSATQGQQFTGMKLIAGLRAPQAPDDKMTLRSSVARIFDASSTSRYSLLVHIGYPVVSNTEIAFLGGVGYLASKSNDSAYLKPIIGGEVTTKISTWGSSSLSAFAAYEVVSGTSGSIGLDAGSDELAAKSFSIGLTFSFRLLGETVHSLR